MGNLKIRNNSYPLPASWEELSDQPVKVYKKIVPFLGKDTPENRTAVLIRLIPDWKSRRNLRADLRLVANVERSEGGGNIIYQILRALDWAFLPREIGEREEISPNQPGFKIWAAGPKYLFPQPGLYDVTTGEWQYIDSYLRKYIQTQERDDLLLLLATMARPAKSKAERKSEKYDGYPRIKFNPERIQDRAAKLKWAPDWVLHCCMDFASRGAQYLKQRYSPMFQGKSSRGKSYGWEGIVTSLAESQVFGDERQVRETLIHKTCRYYCMKIEQDRQHKEKLKDLRSQIIA